MRDKGGNFLLLVLLIILLTRLYFFNYGLKTNPLDPVPSLKEACKKYNALIAERLPIVLNTPNFKPSALLTKKF